MSTPTRVFITGGTGFIGKHLINRMLGDGMSVLALARNPSALPLGVEAVLQQDLLTLDVDSAAKFMKSNQVDIVVHLAAAMHFYPKDENYVWNVNVEGTRKLAKASIQAGTVKKFIYISSTEAMGGSATNISSTASRNGNGGSERGGGEARDETAICAPFFHYGSSKLAAEQVLKELAPQLRYVILRLTGVLGPEDDFAMYELIQAVSLGLFFFVPKNDGKVMFTHVHDVVSGIMSAIPDRTDIIGKTYIICPDDYLTYSDAITLICKELHRIPPFISLPIPVIRMVTILLDPIMNFGQKKKVFLFKRETVNRMAEDRWYSNAKAKKELGFVPQYSFSNAIKHTIQHMVNKKQVCTWYISPVGIVFLLLVASLVFKML